jgi:predicted DNA-binding transcriptional regulator YafY
MRAARLVQLLLLLQTRGQLTAADIAVQLEVSVRTVHRDVGSLSAAGDPVETVRGPAGGYRLPGGYRTRLTGLTTDEADALFAAGMPGPAAELGLGHELAAARLKLLAALPAELQERAERSQRLFHLDSRGWFRAEDRVPQLPELSAAVWRGCRVRLRYREGKAVVRRTVDPLGLVLKGGAWYLVAQRSVGMRVYRVSRVVSVRALDEPCERPAGFELAGYWQEWSRAFEESRPRVEVLARGPKGERTLVFESLEHARRELLRHGDDLEVLAPEELRASVAETARRVVAQYVT